MINIILDKIIVELEIHIKACMVSLDGTTPEYEDSALDKIQAFRNAIRIVKDYKEGL